METCKNGHNLDQVGRLPDGHCKRCHYDRNRRNELKKRYGITPEDRDALIEAQAGGCGICGTSETRNGRRLDIDHDHESGKVRGLLCSDCNLAIGLLKDSSARARLLAAYLERHGR